MNFAESVTVLIHSLHMSYIVMMPQEYHSIPNHWQRNCMFNFFSGKLQKKYQSFELLAFCEGNHLWLVGSP